MAFGGDAAGADDLVEVALAVEGVGDGDAEKTFCGGDADGQANALAEGVLAVDDVPVCGGEGDEGAER